MGISLRPGADHRRRADHRPGRDHPGPGNDPPPPPGPAEETAALILITHDIALVAQVCDTDRGHVRRPPGGGAGPSSKIISRPAASLHQGADRAPFRAARSTSGGGDFRQIPGMMPDLIRPAPRLRLFAPMLRKRPRDTLARRARSSRRPGRAAWWPVSLGSWADGRETLPAKSCSGSRR